MFTWPWTKYRARIKELEKLVEEERSARLAAQPFLHVDAPPKERGFSLVSMDGGRVTWATLGIDDRIGQRLKQLELHAGREMQGRWFTKPGDGESRRGFMAFYAKSLHPSRNGGPGYTGRLTSFTSPVETTVTEEPGVRSTTNVYKEHISVTDRAELSVSDLLDWYMVPVNQEASLKAEIKKRALLLTMTDEERQAEPRKRAVPRKRRETNHPEA